MWQAYLDTRNGHSHTVSGNLQVLQDVESPWLGNQRDILVYLPPGYESSDRRYPVLYLQDGQNLFDAATSYAGEWQVDETLEALSREGIEAIAVGIPNAGVARINEYSPFNTVDFGHGRGDLYLDFVEEVKALVDAEFRTLSGPTNTGIMGSSMGGLISLYAFFRRPETFGLAGAMSPSLWFAKNAIFDTVRLAPPNAGRLYLDAGTREYGGVSIWTILPFRSRRYYASVRRMYRLVVKKGYRPKKNVLYVEDKDAGHNEAAWARRLPSALRFLLGNTAR